MTQEGKPLQEAKDAIPNDADAMLEENVTEAKTASEATAPCQDCGAKFMTPHEELCPQAAMQNKILANRKAQEKKPQTQEMSVAQACEFIKEHLKFLETILNPTFLAHYNHSNYITLCDNIKTCIREPDKK